MILNVKAFGMALGLLWGLGVFFGTWYMIFLYGCSDASTVLGRIYLGHTLTPLGSAIGLAWGLVDGFIAGALLAWLYNSIARRFDA